MNIPRLFASSSSILITSLFFFVVCFVGKGTGSLNICAECMNLQETYSLCDCIFYDDGVTSPKTVTWYNQNSAYTLTPSTDGTLVEISQTTALKLFADGTTYSNSQKFPPNVCVEVEIVSNTGNDNQFIISANKNPTILIDGSAILKMTWDGSTVTKYKDGEIIGTTTGVTSEKIGVGFNCTNGSFKFKNFKIYPI